MLIIEIIIRNVTLIALCVMCCWCVKCFFVSFSDPIHSFLCSKIHTIDGTEVNICIYLPTMFKTLKATYPIHKFNKIVIFALQE